MADSLTIIVPTRNRSVFLRRLLHYFWQQKTTSLVLIADSSDSAEFRLNADVVHEFSSTLNVRHQFDPSGFVSKCRRAVDSVQTPYSVFCADDDFLLLDSAAKCVRFLETNNDYSCATGSWVAVDPSRGNRFHQTRCFAIDDSDPVDRFSRLANNWYANFYCVFRTHVLRRSWAVADDATKYERGRVFTELLLSHLAVLYGKQAILPQLHLLFQLHEENDHRTKPLVADQASTIELYNQFSDALASEMSRVCESSIETCREIVNSEYGFWMYDAPVGVGKSTGIKRIVKNVRNQILLLRDLVVRDSTNIRLRRRIRSNSRLCQSDSWQQALKMALEHPYGIRPVGSPANMNAA